jgi:hypothetical protein
MATLTHPQVWTAIDRLAARYGYSASGLAKKAGLDPTSFNKSKRITPEGRPRWPSTESIAKILHATGSNIEEFMTLLYRKPKRAAARHDRSCREGGWCRLRVRADGRGGAVQATDRVDIGRATPAVIRVTDGVAVNGETSWMDGPRCSTGR